MSHRGFKGRDAFTRYRVLVYYKDSSLLEVSPRTGRTHQIRVHLAAIGHGIIGDTLYGVASKQMHRPALHAWKLAFTYKDHAYHYLCHVPDDFKQLLYSLAHSR